MTSRARRLVQGAIIAALYTVLTLMQNMLLPGSGSWAVQFRLSEGLCVLAFFTPAAAPGLALGCLLFNLTVPGLPLDFLVGTAASFLAGKGMWLSRKWTVRGWPAGLLLPAVCNGLLVGWELSVYVGGGFWMNAGYVALGEAIVMMTAGAALYWALKRRKIAF